MSVGLLTKVLFYREDALAVLGVAFCLGSLLRPGVFCHGVFLTKLKKCEGHNLTSDLIYPMTSCKGGLPKLHL